MATLETTFGSVGSHRLVRPLALIAAVVMVSGALVYGQSQGRSRDGAPPVAPRDLAKDLAMKITAPFTLATVGDIIMSHPIARLNEPGLQNLVKVMREADMTFANQEGPIPHVDAGKEFETQAYVDDLKAFGIRIMGTANNHTVDRGAEGVLETNRLLDKAGIAHAGSGKDLQDARAAHFAYTPKGRVGVVSMFSIDSPPSRTTSASYSSGNQPGTIGLNPLRLTIYNVVTQDQLEALRKIRDAVYARRGEVPYPIGPLPANQPKDELQLFGTFYKAGPATGELSYRMDQGDLSEILRSIRNGKHLGEFVIATIHCHQNRFAFQTYTFDNGVPDFLVELAHKAIDAGADAFVGHGVHTLRGVEIYNGKPIFYGVSNFVNQLGQPSTEQGPAQTNLSGAETGVRNMDWVLQPDNLEALLATSRYEGGQLVEVRLYPADLGLSRTRPLSSTGIPMTPSPEVARRILEKVQALSKPFGTTIAIENNLGVIRVSPQRSSASR